MAADARAAVARRAPPARREEVLETARALFHQQGFAATSTRDLAAHLGILGGSLYYYIESKEALLLELLAGVHAPGAAALSAAVGGDGPAVARLRPMLDSHVRAITDDPVGIALLFAELGALPPEHHAEIGREHVHYRRALVGLLAESQEDGSGRADVAPDAGAMAILGALNWTYRWYAPDRDDAGAVASGLTTLVLDGLAVPGPPRYAPSSEHEAWLAAAVAPPAPGQARRERRADQLLRVAAQLFYERGFEATSTADIADAVGLRKASLYHYMSSKEELLYTLTARVQQASLDALTSLAALDLDPLDRLVAVLRFHVRYLTEHLVRTSLVLHQLRALDAEHRAVLVDLQRRYAGAIAGFVAEAQAAGAVRPELDPERATLGLLGAVNWPYRWFRPDRGALTATALADATAAVLVDGWAARPAG